VESHVITADDGVFLHVGGTGVGPDVLVLSGGPGCVHYLEDDDVAPRGVRAWYPEPRGVGRSGGGPHEMAQAVSDLEAVRRALGVESWMVLGHSWGADLSVRYALQHPESVRRVIAIAGCGVQKDRTWSETYHALKDTEPDVPIEYEPDVHAALVHSYLAWIHEPQLFRDLADSTVPMRFIAAERDVRPSWPLQQLAALVPRGTFERVPAVPHHFWFTDPEVWVAVVTRACRE
jgi:proline iminopeptidase